MHHIIFCLITNYIVCNTWGRNIQPGYTYPPAHEQFCFTPHALEVNQFSIYYLNRVFSLVKHNMHNTNTDARIHAETATILTFF